MTLDEFINHNKGILKQINHGEEVLKYLEELVSARAYIDFLQDTIGTLDYKLEVYEKALELASKDVNVSGYWDIYLTREEILNAYLREAKEELQKAREQE